MLRAEEIVQIGLAANLELEHLFGEPEDFNWFEVGAVGAVKYAQNSLSVSPQEFYRIWCENRVSEGWSYGSVLDFETKQHPEMVSWEQLNSNIQLKVKLFLRIIVALSREQITIVDKHRRYPRWEIV